QYAHRDHLCIPCSKIEQGIQSRGSKFDENYSLRWVSSAWTSTPQGKHSGGAGTDDRSRTFDVCSGGGDRERVATGGITYGVVAGASGVTLNVGAAASAPVGTLAQWRRD
ncbi:hypothetical protein, partial [Burkholderia sp. AU28942]|uniref:hypothetical protein n=1 Tax=Burkholderia sp. AU28942 TaxID=2879626 RepID=UPI0039AF2666